MIRKLLAIPYVPGGRSIEGADCWGMVQICYSKLMGVEIPSYDDVYNGPSDRISAAGFIMDELGDHRHFERLIKPERGCFALLSVAGNPIHVGFMLDSQQMIHTRAGLGPSVDNVTTIKWKGRILGFYNYRPANDR